MAGGGFAAAAEGVGHGRDYGGGVTVPVVVTCLMAASCGLIFGYDIGVSGAYPPPGSSVIISLYLALERFPLAICQTSISPSSTKQSPHIFCSGEAITDTLSNSVNSRSCWHQRCDFSSACVCEQS
jgi:hypothetical protein